MTVLTFLSVDEDAGRARRALEAPLRRFLTQALAAPLIRAAGVDPFSGSVPVDWTDRYAVAGDPLDCAAGIEALFSVGADSVVVCPFGATGENMDLLADEVLPRVKAGGDAAAPGEAPHR